MATVASLGFDADFYLQEKAAQMGASTTEALAAITAAGLTLEEHYLRYGYQEGLSPNKYFNADQYAAAKAAQMGGGATAATFINAWYAASGSTNVYFHYLMYGDNEGVNPSNGFDENAYYVAKAAQMGGGATAADAKAAIEGAGLTALTHYMLYGINESLSYTPTPVGTTGQTYNLTTGVDNIPGTTGNDTFNAALGGAFGTALTLNTLDSLNGGGGTDTLNVELAGPASSVTPAHLDNIEVLTITGSGTLGLANAGEVTSLGLYGTTGATTVNDIVAGAALTVQDTAFAATFNYADTTGTTDTAALTVNGVGTSLASPVITIDGVETVTTNATGSTSYYTLTDNAATTLNFTGSAAQTVGLGATVLNVSLFDASSATGAVNLTTIAQTGVSASTVVTVNGGSGNDSLTVSAITQKLSVSGGAGNDTIDVGAIAATDTIDGGDGTDTLGILLANIPTTALTHVSNIEGVTITDAALNAPLTLSNIQAGISTANLSSGSNGGTVTFDSGVAGTVNLYGTANAGALTVVSAGTGAADAITIANASTTANLDMLNGKNVTATGVETLTINDSTTATTAQTVGAITATSGTTAVVFTGNNQITTTAVTGVITGGSIDASGLTGATGLTMGAAASGVTSITGSAGKDTLIGQAAASTTIDGGAGNDTITGGTKADSITAGDGDDSINGGGGNDTILGGAGNDYFDFTTSALTSGTVVTGGDGTNTLALAGTAATASTAQGISGMETLSFTAAVSQDMAVFVNNSTFTQLDFDAANVLVTNAGAGISTLQLGFSGGTDSFARLTDTDSDSLTITSKSGAGAISETALTVSNEETLAINSGTTSGDSLTIGTLTAADLTSLTATGSNNVTLMSVVSATKLATVDASDLTGTFSINASSSTVDATFTGSTSAANTIVGGSGNDSITGGSAGDSLSGGVGNDTIIGGAGDDILLGGSGADNLQAGSGDNTITGGSGNDTIDLTAGGSDTVSYTATTDGHDTVTGFTAGSGTGADVIKVNTLATAATVTTSSNITISGIDLTNGTGTDTNIAVLYSSDIDGLTTSNFSTASAGADTIYVDAADKYMVAFATSSSSTTVELYQYDASTSGLTDLGTVSLTGSTTLADLTATNFSA